MVTVLPVVGVDVEAAVIAALRPVLPAGTVVATEVPRTASGDLRFPARMVRVTRTGGVLFSPAHDRPTVLVECWAAVSTDAWALAGAARQAMTASLTVCQSQESSWATSETARPVPTCRVAHFAQRVVSRQFLAAMR